MAVSAAKSELTVLTVSQLTRRVKGLLEDRIGEVWVGGEISNWRVSPAGHAYFTLKDEHSQLSAVMFKGSLRKLKFEPEGGLEAVVFGRCTVYEQRGQYQIICEDMQPKGVGALQLAFEKLKKKLSEEGLFDEEHKQPLPMLPRRIGIVTSPTGAAIRDILNVINRRFANVHIILFPARVQGDEAPPEIVKGITVLDRFGVDVMIVGRGGGSLEDLWAFNDERVVRAVFKAQTPIISAVGHEIDYSLTDFAADVRAPTPSAAAELVVKEQQALAEQVGRCKERMAKSLRYRLEQMTHRLRHAKRSYVFQRPEELVVQHRQRLDDVRLRLEHAVTDQAAVNRRRMETAGRSLVLLSPANRIHRAADRLAGLRGRLSQSGRRQIEHTRAHLRTVAAQLDGLSPLRILNRGYAVAFKMPGNTLVRRAHDLSPGDKLQLRFGRGRASATVDDIEDENGGEETGNA